MTKLDTFGKLMGVTMKIAKHLQAGNLERLKDYVLHIYDDVHPHTKPEDVPITNLPDAIGALRAAGWKVGPQQHPTWGLQVICISPDGMGRYHSKYVH